MLASYKLITKGAVVTLATLLMGGAAGCSMAQMPAAGVPAECLNMDLSPYSAPQNLDVAISPQKTAHFSVEIADNEATREQGLMCRTKLADDQGMLFEFQDIDTRTFWMKDTLLGLDIIYIAPDGKIVSIAKNAKPLDRTPLPSNGVANGVLEVRAGLSDELGLKPGDQVIHPFFH